MSTKFTYYGGMCVLIERSDGFKILCDPFLDKNPMSPIKSKDVYDVDLIIVSHNAGDHFGDAMEIMKNSNAKLMAPTDTIYVVRELAPELKSRTISSAYGDERTFGMTKTHTVWAQHQSKGDVNGQHFYGVPAGFVIDIEPGVSYYHTGDTAIYGDMRLIRELYAPNIMCVGIDGIKTTSSREMGPRQAAMAASYVGASVVIPTHYPKGSPAPEEFKFHAASFIPNAIIKDEIGISFTVTPMVVE